MREMIYKQVTWRGDQRGLELLSSLSTRSTIAIVGARLADSTGLAWTRDIAKSAHQHDVTLVSGDARGVDSCAHQVICESGGESVAVLGCGLDHVSRRHRALAELGVGLITPFEPHQTAKRWTFPKRNELIAELADTLIVVQAGESSGALSAARAALRRGRRVWALPHLPTHPLHRGCLKLLSEGAQPLLAPDTWVHAAKPSGGHVTQSTREVTDRSDHREVMQRERPTHTSELWRASTSEPEPLSTLAQRAEMSYEIALAEATLLELEGWLEPSLGGLYRRAYG